MDLTKREVIEWANQNSEVVALLAEAQKNGFYGLLVYQFKGGKLFLIRREETIIPNSGKTEGVMNNG